MNEPQHDWTLRMTLQIRFRGKSKEQILDLFSSWWREQGRCHDITATEITTLFKTPAPPAVEISGEDLL